MAFFKRLAVLLAQIHDRLHVDFVKGGQHRGGVFASSRRSATRLRRRVIGTRFSERPASGAGAASGAAFASSFAGAFARCFSTSSRVRRPPTPVPLMALASRLCSASRRRIAGLSVSLFCSSGKPADAEPAWTLCFQLWHRWLYPRCCLRAGGQGSGGKSRSCLHLPEQHRECRQPTPVLPVPLCQFRFLPALHREQPRRPVSCAVATVASATDSGRSGTRISTLLIVYPLFNRRSARH